MVFLGLASKKIPVSTGIQGKEARYSSVSQIVILNKTCLPESDAGGSFLWSLFIFFSSAASLPSLPMKPRRGGIQGWGWGAWEKRGSLFLGLFFSHEVSCSSPPLLLD